MYELPDRYVFETLLDGKVFFHKKSYQKHARRHPIGSQEDREKIQETLINPHSISEYERTVAGRIFRHRVYYWIEVGWKTKMETAYLKWWQIVIRRVGYGRWQWCIVTAFRAGGSQDKMVSRRVGRIVYKRNS